MCISDWSSYVCSSDLMAVQFLRNQGASGRTRFVGFRHGYHGDSIGTMSVSDPESSFHWMFKVVLPNQIVRDLPRDATALAALDAFLAKEAGSLAAVILEPLVKCAGGMKFHTPAVLRDRNSTRLTSSH